LKKYRYNMINLFFDNEVHNSDNIIKNLSDHSVMNLPNSEIHRELKALDIPYSINQIGVDFPVEGEKNIYPVENFLPKGGKDGLRSLFDVIPEQTKVLLRDKKIDILIFFPYEGFDLMLNDWSDNLELSFRNNDLENANKILIFGNLEIESLYNQSKSKNFWDKTIGIDYWQYSYADDYKIRTHSDKCEEEIKIEDIFKIKHKDYLCFNGSMRPPRILFHSELKRNKLDKIGYISALERNFNKNYFDEAHDYIKNNPEKSHYLETYFKNWEPCVLDVSTDTLIEDDRKKDKNLYCNSYYSMVTETCVQDGIFVTEKTFKPIVNLHPFMVLGCPRLLEYLRKQGYYTFPELFDEDYDYETDVEKRIEIILENMRQFSNLLPKEKDHKLRSVRKKLIHNRETFLNENNKNKKTLRKLFQEL